MPLPSTPVILRQSEISTILDNITLIEDDLFTVQTEITSLQNQSQNMLVRLIFIEKLADLPTPIAGVITLNFDTSYYFTTTVDLNGNRLFCQANVCILGSSSEISKIISTGLTSALITSNNTLTIRHITLSSTKTLDINALGNNAQLNWNGVNFQNTTDIGIIQNVGNIIYDRGAFLNASGLVFSGTISTIAIAGSAITPGSGTAITLDSNATILSRFRVIYSSIIVGVGRIGINVNALAIIPVEAYILDTVNFIGIGTAITGVTDLSNKSLFVNCKGIVNTTVSGQMFMQNNAVATVVTTTNEWYKVLGTTIGTAENIKYEHTANRLTNRSTLARLYYTTASLSFASGNNDACEFAYFDSKTGAINNISITSSTANGSGRSENISIQGLFNHSDGNFLEIWARNTSGARNITVLNLNVIIISR